MSTLNLGGALLINANLFDIATLRPVSFPTAECFQIRGALVQVLPSEHTQFNFCYVQTNCHVWECNESPTDQATAVLRQADKAVYKEGGEAGVRVFNWS